MIRLISVLLVFAQINSGQAAEPALNQTAPQPEKRYTQPGYPFGNLAIKADRVTLRFTDNQGTQINCSVDVTFGSRTWSSKTIEAEQEDFTRDPLRACLLRDTAKQFLQEMYQVDKD